MLILFVGISSFTFANDEIHVSELYKFKVPVIGKIEVKQNSILNNCYLSDDIQLDAKTLLIIDISAHYSQVFDNCNRVKYEWNETDERYETISYDSLDHDKDINMDDDLSKLRIEKERVSKRTDVNDFQCDVYLTKVFDGDELIAELRESYSKKVKNLNKLHEFRKDSGLISPLEFLSVLEDEFMKKIESFSVKSSGILIKSDIKFFDSDGDEIVTFSYEVLMAEKKSGTSDVFKSLPENLGY